VDVLARCFLNLHRWKNKINANLSLIIFLSHPEEQSAITINHKEISDDVRSEVYSTHLLLDILSNDQELEIKTEKTSFEDLLKSLAENYRFYYLTPNGTRINKLDNRINESGMCFVLGSQHDLTQNQENILYDFNTIPLSLGKQNYLASHVITIVCYKLYSLSNFSQDS